MKKILALCLTVMLVIAMVPVIGVAAADAVTVEVGSASAKRGEEVTVAVSITSNPGTANAVVSIAYDADVLEVVSSASSNLAGVITTFSPVTENPFIVNFASPLANVTAVGDIATVTFKVKDDAAFGESALTLIAVQDDFFDTAMNDVPFAVVDGAIEVVCPHANTGKFEGSDPDCVNEGLTEGKYCLDCQERLVEQKPIPALGHTEELVNAKAHTATEDGYTGDVVCSVCDAMIKEGEVIAAGHIVEEVEAKDATCEDAGNIAHYACTLCDAIFADAEKITDEDAIAAEDVVVEALGHKYGDWKVTKEATATEKGSKEKVCATCGDKVTEEIAALGAPADDKDDDKAQNADKGDKAPATNDVANIYVVVAMLVAIAAASVVVLKKKA